MKASDLYSNLLEILHQKPRSRVVRQFLADLEEKPFVEKTGTSSFFHFPSLGFRFDFDRNIGYIWCITLCSQQDINIGKSRHLRYQTFLGTLPADITFRDHKNEVRRKLESSPKRSSRFKVIEENTEDFYVESDLYCLPPYKMAFNFRSSDKRLLWIGIFKSRLPMEFSDSDLPAITDTRNVRCRDHS